MSKFKKGDRVVCVSANQWVKVGTTGTVPENTGYPYVTWDNGDVLPIHESNIELIKEDEMKKEIELDGKKWEAVHDSDDVKVLKRVEDTPVPVVAVYISKSTGIPVMAFNGDETQEHWPWLSIAGRIVAAYHDMKYIAVDADGDCFGYTHFPYSVVNRFNPDVYYMIRLVRIPEKFRAPDWRTTLFEVRHV